LAPQTIELSAIQLEDEVVGKALPVAHECSIERLGLDSIELAKVRVEDDLPSSNDVDDGLDRCPCPR
jgi:hypothetical protein